MEKKKFPVKAEINVDLTQQDIDDIMVAALEGGIDYWCFKAEVIGDYLGEYASEQISRGGMLKLYDMESGEKYWLDLEKFLKEEALLIIFLKRVRRGTVHTLQHQLQLF